MTVLAAAMFIPFVGGPAIASGVEATLIDGARVTGDWVGSSDAAIELNVQNALTLVSLDDLTELRFQTESTVPSGGVYLFLADGGHLQGELLNGEHDAVAVRTTVFKRLELPFDRLAGIQWTRGQPAARAEELFKNALEKRLPAEDVLISDSSEGAKALRGRVERLDGKGGSFALGGRSRSFLAERVFGVVFAAGVRDVPSNPARVTLADGSVFSGRIERGDDRTLWMNGTLGAEIPLPVSSIDRLALKNPRIVYLSDLRPTDETIEGRLHSPWPVCYDRNVSGGPISMGSAGFEKGIGVHSRTVITYELAGPYKRFLATVGIDDSVRPRGSVVFRVHSGDKTLFDSGEIRGTDEPEEVNVDISGVERLTLEVDYGESWDISDHANWAAARLIRSSTEISP